jgi:hypothetical protein
VRSCNAPDLFELFGKPLGEGKKCELVQGLGFVEMDLFM